MAGTPALIGRSDDAGPDAVEVVPAVRTADALRVLDEPGLRDWPV